MSGRTRTWLLVFALLGLGASGAAAYTHSRLLSQAGDRGVRDINGAPSGSQARLSRVAAGQAAAAPAPVTGAQRTEFERWYDALPHTNLPVPASGAKVLIVKFTDYTCPACAATHFQYRDVLARWDVTNPGAVRVVDMDFPLNPACNAAVTHVVHPLGCDAAVAVRLATARGKRDEMADWLYANQPALTPASIREAARRVAGLDDFNPRDPAAIAAIKTDAALGALNGVHSTPTYFINGTVVSPPLSPQFFDQAIAIELKRATTHPE